MTEQEKNTAENWYPAAEPVDPTAPAAWYAASAEVKRLPQTEGDDVIEDAADGAEELRRERRGRRTRIIALCLCGALLLSAAGTVLVRALRRTPEVQTVSGGFSVYPRPEIAEGSDDAETYDDFREYFENYYTGSDRVDIPRAETDGGVCLTLYEPTDRELSLQEIYALVSPAVVGITATRGGVEYSWGTGVVFTPDGYIITNTHIIAGCDGARISFPDGQEFEALLVGEDSASDIAVLKMEGENFPCAVFGSSDALRVGDLAVAIGNPLGEEYAGTMTNGIISAINRNVRNNGHNMTLLQTNAALNEGNSGGPLVNACGQVIGITNMKIMSVLYNTVEGIGFAIPSSVVKEVADQLIAQGVVSGKPSIGITAAPVSEEAMEIYGLPNGVYVASVNGASASGLEVGDIILEVNGVPVASVADVNTIKDDFGVGDTLTLTVYRDGATITIICVLVDQAALE